MSEPAWTDRVAEQKNTVIAVKCLKYVLGQMDAQSGKQPDGSYVNKKRPEVTVLTSGSYETYLAMAGVLTEILGKPVRNENVSVKDEVTNHAIDFTDGTNLVFMLSLSDGISVTIPKANIENIQKGLSLIESKIQMMGGIPGGA